MAVYLIHFERKLKHAQHYIGYASDVGKRMERHRSGAGARILRACNEAGIDWSVVKTWPDGDKTFERNLKKRRNAKLLCPTCRNSK